MLWQDLPVSEPRQLTSVLWKGPEFPRDLADGASGSMYLENGTHVADFFSYPGFELMRQKLSTEASLAAFCGSQQVSVSFAGRASVAQERAVTGNFLSTVAVRPELGRLLSDKDDRYSAPRTVVVSHRFWMHTLESDPRVLGRTLFINNAPNFIVGVLDLKSDAARCDHPNP